MRGALPSRKPWATLQLVTQKRPLSRLPGTTLVSDPRLSTELPHHPYQGTRCLPPQEFHKSLVRAKIIATPQTREPTTVATARSPRAAKKTVPTTPLPATGDRGLSLFVELQPQPQAVLPNTLGRRASCCGSHARTLDKLSSGAAPTQFPSPGSFRSPAYE